MPGPFYFCSFLAGAGLALVLLLTWPEVREMSRDIKQRHQLAAGFLSFCQVAVFILALGMIITGIWGAAYG